MKQIKLLSAKYLGNVESLVNNFIDTQKVFVEDIQFSVSIKDECQHFYACITYEETKKWKIINLIKGWCS